MTGEPEGLGLYGMVTPFGGDWGIREKNWVTAHFQHCWSSLTVKQHYTSSITTQICLTHSMMDCGVPAMVMARSVELGNMSPATCTWAPADCKNITTWQSYTMATIFKKNLYPTSPMQLTSLISLILQPPLPMSEPHWLAGTTRRMVTGGLLVAVLLVIEVLMSWTENGGNKV